MSSSQREDFLIRQMKALAAMLARVAGLRVSGEPDAARAELDRTYGELLGSRGDLIRSVDSATAAMLLDAPDRIRVYARLLLEEAELAGEGDRAVALRSRATELAAEAERRGSPTGPG